MKRFFAYTFALLILFSNNGLTLGTHYCNGKAVRNVISLQKEDIQCSLNNAIACDLPSDVAGLQKTSCCSNTYIQISHDVNFLKTQFKQQKENASILKSLVKDEILYTLEEPNPQADFLPEYKVPLPITDIPVLNLSLLI